jgi:hypothetical protein
MRYNEVCDWALDKIFQNEDMEPKFKAYLKNQEIDLDYLSYEEEPEAVLNIINSFLIYLKKMNPGLDFC